MSQVSYLDLVRCGGRTSRLNARKKAEKPKPKFRSYAEARKGRENFRKRLVEAGIPIAYLLSCRQYACLRSSAGHHAQGRVG